MADLRPPRHEDDRLSAFLDDELSDEDALVVTRHLAGCDRCLSELEDIRSARSLLRGLPNVDPPAGMLHDVSVLAVHDHHAFGHHALGRTTRGLIAALLATAALGAAAFAAGADENGTVVPPIDEFVVDHVLRVDGPILTPVDLGR
jgi:anti-sigma factor RsiW